MSHDNVNVVEQPTLAIQFNDEAQDTIIGYLLTDPVFFNDCKGKIRAGFFNNAFNSLIRGLQHNQDVSPPILEILNSPKVLELSPSKRSAFEIHVAHCKKLAETKAISLEFIKSNLTAWMHGMIFREMAGPAMNQYNKGEIANAISTISKLVEKAKSTSFDGTSLDKIVKSWGQLEDESQNLPGQIGPETFPGIITIYSGAPKEGKSQYLLALCHAISQGRPFRGHPTTRTKVLWLTEEGSTTLTKAKHRLKLPKELDNFPVLKRTDIREIIGQDADPKQLPKLIFDEVLIYCKTNNVGLVVIDTLAKFITPPGTDENSAAMNDALDPVCALRDAGLAVIIIHHSVKNGKGYRGSTSIVGGLDDQIEFSAPNGVEDTVREIAYKGRNGLPSTVGLYWDPNTGAYSEIQNIKDMKVTSMSSALKDFIKSNPRCSVSAVLRNVKGDDHTKRTLLEFFEKENRLETELVGKTKQLTWIELDASEAKND